MPTGGATAVKVSQEQRCGGDEKNEDEGASAAEAEVNDGDVTGDSDTSS